MSNQSAIPTGYHQNAQGHLVPDDLIAPQDLLRDQLVIDLVGHCRAVNERLAKIKRTMNDDVAAFVTLLGEKYGIKLGGKKGNVTLLSYDGLLKIQRARAARVSLGPSILAAEELINELLTEWTDGARSELRVIIDRAFRRNTEGELSVPRLIDLTKVEIKDPRWVGACKAIADALQEDGSVTYFRAYERDAADEPWRAISLDLAAITQAAPNEGK